MDSRKDVVVIGAGPAGLAAAIVLGRHGLQVSVLDRQHLPADKVCGEGIMPPGWQFLDEIGATRHLTSRDCRPFSGIRYITAGGATAEAEFAEGPGRGVRRTALSAALRDVLSECPHVDLQEGVEVSGVAREDDQMAVHSRAHGTIRCRLVVGADGLRSRVRRWAGLEGRPTARPRFGMRCHFRIAPWNRFVEVHAAPGLEAYVTPCGSEQVGVAVLWEKGWVESGGDLFPRLLHAFPQLETRLSGCQALSTPRATGPFDQRTRRRTADGLVLLGDASGYLDPCTGEGLTLAFKQARALEHCVVPLLAHPGPALDRDALLPYERAWRRLMRSYALSTRSLLYCLRRPRLFERIVSYLSDHPDVLRHLLSFNMGTAPLVPGLGRPSLRSSQDHARPAQTP